jgi:hypothetical protein
MMVAKAGLVLVTINLVLQAAEVEFILKQRMCRRCSSWHVCVPLLAPSSS